MLYLLSKHPLFTDILFFLRSAIVATVEAEVNNATLQAVAPVVQGTVAIIQSQLDGLGAASQAIAGALDELSKLHPFVAGERSSSSI